LTLQDETWRRGRAETCAWHMMIQHISIGACRHISKSTAATKIRAMRFDSIQVRLIPSPSGSSGP
jgi:hypothetical protein